MLKDGHVGNILSKAARKWKYLAESRREARGVSWGSAGHGKDSEEWSKELSYLRRGPSEVASLLTEEPYCGALPESCTGVRLKLQLFISELFSVVLLSDPLAQL